jgi:hypothetical protein
MSKLIDRDRGYKALFRRLAGAKNRKVTVGVHEQDGAASHSEDLTILDVASFHEFGTATVPQRSFIAAWADEQRPEIEAAIRKAGEALVTGAIPSADQALNRLGVKFVGDVQQRIRSGIEPPLAQSTIDSKGSSTPLVDTGQLFGSISYKVE